MKFDVKDIKARAKKDFETTWLETAKTLPDKSPRDYVGGRGAPHPLHVLAQDIRRVLLGLGFDEVENSVFVPEDEIFLQYGPEAPVILDRVYYLAGLPRPDIGLSNDKIAEVHKINPHVKPDILQALFRSYREGGIEGDNLFDEMVSMLGIKTEDAARIIDLFPEFRNLSAVSEKMTLRSHMTAAWFTTLKAMQHKQNMPIRLFSIGMRFRREQKLDATHLRAHYGASVVIMDPEISLDAGNKVAEKIFNSLNFKDINFVLKKATSNYYAPNTEYEVFSSNIEIGDSGMYSPVALANYGIEYPVFNIGFGLERILMVRDKVSDVREVLYPQFHRDADLSDKDIVNHISFIEAPTTEEGKKLASMISEVGRKHAEAPSPCKFKVFSGKFLGKNIEVNILEKESNTKLLGPAALNEIYVLDSGVYGVPLQAEKLKEDIKDIRAKGVKAGFDFFDAASNYFAAEVENAISKGEKEGFFQLKMAKVPSEVNIAVSDVARRFITSKNRPIAVKGPIFAAAEFLLK